MGIVCQVVRLKVPPHLEAAEAVRHRDQYDPAVPLSHRACQVGAAVAVDVSDTALAHEYNCFRVALQ